MLRRLRDADADYEAMARWQSDPRVLEWYGGRDQPLSLGSVTAQYGPDARGETPLTPNLILRDGAPAGYLQYYPVEGGERAKYELESDGTDPRRIYAMDLFIGEPALWGSGIGGAVINAVTAFLIAELGADLVVIDPRVANHRAIRCYEKCGFRIVNRLPAHELHEGRHDDCWLMVREAAGSGQ